MTESRDALAIGGPSNIYTKIAALKESLVIAKTGYDEKNDYHYFKADDVAKGVHDGMKRHGIVHKSTIDRETLEIESYWDKQGRNRFRTTALVMVSFIDKDNGSYLQTDVLATGSDIGGDKATRKMMVQAFKEAAIDIFGVTEGMGGFDSDSDTEHEPDVESPQQVQAEAAKAAIIDSKELGVRIEALIKDDDKFAHVDSDLILEIGQKVAGPGVPDRKWRRDGNVLAEVIKRIEAGEVSEAKNPTPDAGPDQGEGGE